MSLNAEFPQVLLNVFLFGNGISYGFYNLYSMFTLLEEKLVLVLLGKGMEEEELHNLHGRWSLGKDDRDMV